MLGSYLPPVFKINWLSCPPHTIISLPVHTAVCKYREEGALVPMVAVQLSVPGLYLPPVPKALPSNPPHTIISLPVHTAVFHARPEGALTVLVAVQLSVMGLSLPPVLPPPAPQTIISLPVHTAV